MKKVECSNAIVSIKQNKRKKIHIYVSLFWPNVSRIDTAEKSKK